MRRKKFDDRSKSNSKATVVWVVCAVILIAAIAVFGFFAAKASTDKIYKGVYVGTVDVGGLSETEALKKLTSFYKINDMTFRFSCEGVDFEIYGSQIGIAPDFEETAKKAAGYGKNGNVFSKISAMHKLSENPENLDISISCDKDVLKYQITEKLSDKIVDVQPYAVELGEDCLKVTNGKNGVGVNENKVIELMSEALTEGRLSEVITFELESIDAEKIDPDKFFNEYNREAKNAECIEENGTLNITPEVIGVELDKKQTVTIIEENYDNENEYTIPAVITYPEITTEKLEAEYTDTIIGTYHTDYSSSSANRKENIRLASVKINGLVLNPGEVFSFNGVVGPRTEATGYKVAHVYSGNKVVDGIGGGICQVSSTLYNAVVLADLEIVYRTNHSIPVSYVPLGRDATVSYGTIDFKFKNDKATPVKFEVIADGNRLTVNIYGRKKYKKDISIETNVTGSVPFSTTEIPDDTMYEGERKVEEAGSNGSRVEAYKIVKENGQVVSRTLLCRSNYSPVSATVRVGTKKKEVPPPTPAPEVTPAQPVQEEPVVPADAGNSPAVAPVNGTADVPADGGGVIQ